MQKQTAVEWLLEQLQAPCRGIPSHIIEQAKEMESTQMKEQRLEGYKEGIESASTYYSD